MLPSTQKAGFSLSGPVAKLVQDQDPDVTPFVALAHRFQAAEIGVFGGARLQNVRHIIVTIIGVKAYLGHGISLADVGG